ncbi:F-box/LRR-repeat protein At4g14103-like isoform X1 [Typha latifolia]|uniref:F-box/LRR-repeat protein At4g14103-like isoform X1 n=2 Tax=Typha latifolia TaxID=4733 RepID=UPI003C2C7E5D
MLRLVVSLTRNVFDCHVVVVLGLLFCMMDVIRNFLCFFFEDSNSEICYTNKCCFIKIPNRNMDKPSSSGIYGSQQSSSGEKEIGNNFPTCLCLSDDILGSILSMLNTRDAARTSVLSRRWRNLWTSTHSINFNMDEMLGIVPHVGKFMDCNLFEGGRDIEQRMLEFIGAVDQCISRYVGRGIEKFTIHMCSSKYYKHLISWVNSAIEMHVQNLELNLNGAAEPFVFPHHLFTAERGSSVKHMSLSFCRLIQSDGFGSLKSLTLENVQLKDNLFSSCLLLEVLTLQNCHGVTKLKIGHPPFCLKNLKVFLTGIRLEVYAKNLVQFEFSGTREAFLYPSIDEYGSFHPFPLDTELSQSEGSNACCIYAPSPDFGGFKLLRSLALQNASFTTERLENLLANCSYLKHLTLEKCNMQLPTFTFQIAGLLHLKYLKICGCRGLMDICVCATNLEIFVFVSHYPHSYPRSNFRLLDNNGNDFSSTTNGLKQLYLQSSKFPNNLLHFSSLTTLSLEDVHLEEEYVRDLLSNCVLLEILNVTRCDDLFSLNITGTSLQLRYFKCTLVQALAGNTDIC